MATARAKLRRGEGGQCVGGRGAVLLEVMLAVALFAGAAAFALSATRSVFQALDRTRREQEAVDLARSRLAELDAGLIPLASLRGAALRHSSGEIGSHESDLDQGRSAWLLDVRTHRSEFTGLSLVELTVSEGPEPVSGVAPADPVRITLRQLIALREIAPKEYEADELIEGLPAGQSEPDLKGNQ